ncbi:MAG: hypothetical protein J6J39_03920 [Clostridia bacterium]|nr:hypothetical protein [Clostridia bacterium]
MKGDIPMNNIHLAPVKFDVSIKMKAKLKATAALNDMTLKDLFMDAVLEKYPFLINKSTEESELQKELDGIAKELKQAGKSEERIKRLECTKNGKKEEY